MARRRTCFASSVCCTDAFADLPASAQALYFQLAMSSDADGAVDGIRKATRAAGFSKEDVAELYGAGFLVDAGGVPFIAHFWVHQNRDRINYRPGDHAHLVGAVLELGEDRVYRPKDEHQSDGSLASVANSIPFQTIPDDSNPFQSMQGNQTEEEEASRAPAELAPCPVCKRDCAAKPDFLGNVNLWCRDHGDFSITADGEVYQDGELWG